MTVALTRPLPHAMDGCELTHLDRTPIDIERARAQHAAYNAKLRDAGCTVIEVAGAPELPDSVFIEDTAVVLDEVAIVTRPGAPSRRPEVAAVAAELALHRPVLRMPAPATLDGGDVLRIDRTLHVGVSGRTNAAGVEWLRAAVEPFGYRVAATTLTGCLHLKTAVTQVTPDLLLVNADWIDPGELGATKCVAVARGEPFAANALRIGDRVIYPAAFSETARRLRDAGVQLLTVDVSELAKAEGGVTCCSIVFDH